MKRKSAYAAVLAVLLPACGSTDPAPEPAPEPAPVAAPADPATPAVAPAPSEPRPSLRFEPGSEHRYRFSVNMGMEMPDSEGMGRIGMELEQEAVHRIEPPGESGDPRVAVTAVWTRVVLFMEGPGIRFTVDSREPATLAMIAEGAPMAGMAELFGAEPVRFEIHNLDVRPLDGPAGAAAPKGRALGPDSMLGGMDKLRLFPWISFMPAPGVDMPIGELDLKGLPGMLKLSRAEDVSWKVVERDPASGRLATELRAKMKSSRKKVAGAKAKPGEFDIDSGSFLVADVFLLGPGVYASRRIEMDGEGKGGPAEMESGEGTMKVRMVLTLERLGDDAAPPAKQP